MVKDKEIYLQCCLRLYLFNHRLRKRLVKLCNHAHRSKTENRVQNLHTEVPRIKKGNTQNLLQDFHMGRDCPARDHAVVVAFMSPQVPCTVNEA